MITAIVVLLSAPADADVVAGLLSGRLRALPTEGVVVERAPDDLLGLDFLLYPERARAWWESSGAAAAERWIMVIDDVPSLALEIDGVASTWIVWCRDPEQATAYDGVPNAHAERGDDPGSFAAAVVEWCARNRELARFVRPTWGPFQRVERRDVDPPLRMAAFPDDEVEVTAASAGVDGSPAHAATRVAAFTVGPPPMDYMPAPTSTSAPRTDGADPLLPSDDGVARHGAPSDVEYARAVVADIGTNPRLPQADVHRPRAAVPPPPPLAVMAVASIPAPPAVERAALPAPPPLTNEAIAVLDAGDRDRMPTPPAPLSPDDGDGSSEMAVTALTTDEGPLGDRTNSDGVETRPPEHPLSHSPAPWVDTQADDGDRVLVHQLPGEIADLVASQATPLDGLPVLEPPQTVSEVAEREPRQIGLSWLPSSLVRRRRRHRAEGAGVDRDRWPGHSDGGSQSAVITTRPTTGMTEPELRGEAARLLMFGPPLVVVCCSRKGGVGKTYDVLGIAELADEAGEAFAVRSVLLEQNLENPDLRVVLGLAAATSTVRQLDRALADGVEAPAAAHPTQSNLSVYVEERETGSYPRESIERLARHCRARYGLTAVDLANCLPDVTGGKAAAVVAHWLRAADVVMLPTDASRSGLEGLAEMIDAVRAQQRPATRLAPGIVIPFLMQPGSRMLEYPGIAEILERYNGQGAQPVAVPFSEETQLAGWENPDGVRTTILDDDGVRLAYWRLLVAVLRAGTARAQP